MNECSWVGEMFIFHDFVMCHSVYLNVRNYTFSKILPLTQHNCKVVLTFKIRQCFGSFKSHTMSMKHWIYNCSKIRNSTTSIKSGQKPIGEGKIIVLLYLLITIITGKAYKSISCMQENKSKTTSGSVIKFHISLSFFRGALKTYWNNSFRSIISSILRKFWFARSIFLPRESLELTINNYENNIH